MKVYFRTDASANTGTGHLMRCLALAQAFAQQGVECLFVVRENTVSFCRARHDWQFPIVTIPLHVSLYQEGDFLEQSLTLQSSDYLVLDSYNFDSDYLNRIRELTIPTVLFDDNNNRGLLPVDLIINGAANAKSLGYEETAINARLCLGSEYRLLRSEFLYEIPQPYFERRSLTLVMGGTDPQGLLLKLLIECEKQDINTPVRAVLTSEHGQLTEIQTFVAQCNMNVQLVLNCQDLANVFSHSLLSISAAGGTQFELLTMQSPAILLIVADNQENASQESAKQGWCQTIDMRKNENACEVVTIAKQLLAQPEKLQLMMDKAGQHRNLNGPQNILDAMAGLAHG